MTEASTIPTVEHTDDVLVGDDPDDEEIENMKEALRRIEDEAKDLRDRQEAEAKALREMQEAESGAADDDRQGADERSIYVGNVDYSASPEEIQSHFQECGTINRVTILCDKFTGHPKGYAYVEFSEPLSVDAAMMRNESLFKGRLIKVTQKRTNIPGFNRGRGGPRRPYRGGYRGGSFGYSPYRARGRGRGRGY